MQSCEYVASITAIACTITKNCSKEEVTELALTLNYLATTLSTLLASEDLNQIEEKVKTKKNSNDTEKKNSKLDEEKIQEKEVEY